MCLQETGGTLCREYCFGRENSLTSVANSVSSADNSVSSLKFGAQIIGWEELTELLSSELGEGPKNH